jgi:hypothetical protein
MNRDAILIDVGMTNKTEGVVTVHPIGVMRAPRVSNLLALRLTARANPIVPISPDMQPLVCKGAFRMVLSTETAFIGSHVLYRRRVSASTTALKVLTLRCITDVRQEHPIGVHTLHVPVKIGCDNAVAVVNNLDSHLHVGISPRLQLANPLILKPDG